MQNTPKRPEILRDTFGRRFGYLRLSITDACNFSCSYCLPGGYQKQGGAKPPLTLPEITRLARAFAGLGMSKIRLTGGEPTLRRDLLTIIDALSSIEGIQTVALSTNGYRLRELAPGLKLAGVGALNVSVDSLDEKRFFEITGGWELATVLSGIDRALELQFASVKINAVLMRGSAEREVRRFIEFVRTRPVAVRFIELMPTRSTAAFFEAEHLRSDFLARTLIEEGWRQSPRGPVDGPALEFTHPHHAGRIGVIAPYSDHFCESCNRLRVTSQGALRLCLFAEGNHDLRPLLQSDAQIGELHELLHSLVARKEVSHFLPAGRTGDNHTFSAIGG